MNTPSLSIPLVVILTVVGWLTWTYLSPPDGLSPSKTKANPIEAALLTPTLVAVAPRDPFRLSAQADERSDAPVSTKRTAAKPGTVQVAPPNAKQSAAAAPNRWVSLWGRLATLVEQSRKELASRAKLAAEAREAVRGQVQLSATSIGGARRLATLNDRVFAEGEVIDALGTLSGPIVLTQVQPQSVTLQYLGSPSVVSFAPGSNAARSASSPVVAKPRPAKQTTKAARPKTKSPSRPSRGKP